MEKKLVALLFSIYLVAYLVGCARTVSTKQMTIKASAQTQCIEEDGEGYVYYVNEDGSYITDEYAYYGETLYYFCANGRGLAMDVGKVTDHIIAIQ